MMCVCRNVRVYDHVFVCVCIMYVFDHVGVCGCMSVWVCDGVIK